MDLAALARLPPCDHMPGVDLDEVHKTGLGSSAALVTSLVGALLRYFLPASLMDEAHAYRGRCMGRDLVHALAQFCHCLAQGKIGSGFDVSSAVYGSQIYRRFQPEILATALSKVRSEATIGMHPN